MNGKWLPPEPKRPGPRMTRISRMEQGCRARSLAAAPPQTWRYFLFFRKTEPMADFDSSPR